VGDSADNKSDSIRKNFDSIRFTGSGVVAKRQKKVMGQLPTLNFMLLKNIQKFFFVTKCWPKNKVKIKKNKRKLCAICERTHAVSANHRAETRIRKQNLA